jgi:thiol-disulfide isomerase/thioredoxin
VQALDERFKQLDKNGDGRITTDELPDSPFFQARDLNRDGAITLAEAQAFLTAESGGPAPVAEEAGPALKVRPTSMGLATFSVRKGPLPLKPGDHGVGLLAPNVTFTDLAGKSYQFGGFAKQRVVVYALTSTSCPLSKQYMPTLQRLAKRYANKQGVTWVLVNPMPTDKPTDMQQAAQDFKGQAIYVHDSTGKIAKSLGAQSTTDVIVLDRARTVVYHGAIDDQYGLGYAVEKPRHNYLCDALDSLLANKLPAIAATDSPGCTLNFAKEPAAESSLTYYGRIARIVQANCVECHRDGGVAPFPLTSYDDVVAHRGMIQQVVEQGTMPPWFAAPAETKTDAEPSSPWANDRSLAAADKHDLLDWMKGKMSEGDNSDAPQPLIFPKDWQIGKPDAIFEFPQPIAVKATGVMPFQYVVVDPHLAEDKWVQAIEVRPSDIGVVHHALVFLQMNPAAPADFVDERNGFFGIYVPGNSTLIYPKGFAKRLPAGARLQFQMHYTPNGRATTDRTRIGVIYSKQPPRHEVRVLGMVNTKIVIPPGAENHREEAQVRIPCDIEILSFLPHMHLRAQACRYRATGNGQIRTLLEIPHYDFNWELLYRYYEPQPVARGETLKFTVWYNNSKSNPANPDPTQTVRWGKQKSDEMHLGYIEFIVPGAKLDE